MTAFSNDKWSGDAQLYWTGGKAGESLVLELEAPATGKFDVSAVLTMARDYAVVKFGLDGKPLGKPFDFYSADVVTSGVLKLGTVDLKKGPHHLSIEITGANPAALQRFMFGLDYVLLKAAK